MHQKRSGNSVADRVRRNLWTAFAVVVATLAGCDGHTSLEGRILDERGQSLSGTTVVLKEPSSIHDAKSQSVTAADGRYSVGLTHAPAKLMLHLSVSRDGYKTHSEETVSGEAYYEHDVTLVKQP